MRIITQGYGGALVVTQGYAFSPIVLVRFVLRAARNRFDLVAEPCRFVIRALRGRFAVGGD